MQRPIPGTAELLVQAVLGVQSEGAVQVGREAAEALRPVLDAAEGGAQGEARTGAGGLYMWTDWQIKW